MSVGIKEMLHWLPEDDKTLLRLLKERKPCQEIARIMGRSPSSIYHQKHRLGQSDGRRPHPVYKDKAIIAKVMQLYTDNWPYKQIAEQTGLSKDMISNLIRKHATIQRRKYNLRAAKTYAPTLIEAVRHRFLDLKMTQKEIAKELGIASIKVRDICGSRGFRRSKKWTPEQIEIMIAIFDAGGSANEVVAKIGRTREAVYKRAYELELDKRFPHIVESRRKDAREYTLRRRLQAIVTSSRRNSIYRGFDHTIDVDCLQRIYNAQQGKCFYTGLPLSPHGSNPNTVSIDRMDSTKSYVPDNVVLCIWHVNAMKQALPIERFEYLCGMIVNHRKVKVEAPKMLPDCPEHPLPTAPDPQPV